MGGIAAVGVHNDLPSGKARISHRAPYHKPACGIHKELGVLIQQLPRKGGPNDLFYNLPPQGFGVNVLAVLGGDYHCIDPLHPAVLPILHGHLAFAVGPQPGQQPGLPAFGEPVGQLMSIGQGCGHQLRSLITGKAEHHSLISGSDLPVIVKGVIYPQGNVRALAVNGGHHRAGVAVKAVFRPVIADFPDGFPGDSGNVHIAAGGDFPHHKYHARGGNGLTGHPGLGILLQNCVQNGIGDLVAYLVRMPLGDGFRCKNTFCHTYIPLFSGQRPIPWQGTSWGLPQQFFTKKAPRSPEHIKDL